MISSTHRVCSEFWNACALPWKLPLIVMGSRSCRMASSISFTAGPSDAPGRKLNETVTDGNCPV